LPNATILSHNSVVHLTQASHIDLSPTFFTGYVDPIHRILSALNHNHNQSNTRK